MSTSATPLKQLPKKNKTLKHSAQADKKSAAHKPQPLDIQGYTAFKIHANKLIP